MADRSVVVRLGANVTGFVNGVRVAERSAVDFGKNAVSYGQKYGAELDSLSMKAGILGAGLTALAGFAVKSAIDWESAWAGVTKTVNGTPEQLAAIEQGLKSMATQIPTTAIELAAIAESAGALGVQTDSILSFTRVMADLGQTTNLTSDEAATSIAQLMNVMQTAPDDVDNLGAALVDLGNKGASTERQIIQMAQNIAGAGSIVGLTEANVLGLSNALASSGIDAEAGGSAISNVLIGISKAVDTNSSKLATFAQVSGTTAKDFAARWKATPAEALTEFVEGLGRMNKSGQDVFSTLNALGLSDIRVTRALLNMAASGDMLRESLANGDTAWERNSALAVEAAKRYDTTAAQTKMAWNEIKGAAVDAGDALLPVVANIAGAVGDVAHAFGSLPGPVKTGLTSIVGIGGLGLLAAAGIMKLVSSVGAAKTSFTALEMSSPRLASKLSTVGKAAGVLGAALVALQVASQFRDDSASVSKYTAAILELGDKGPAALEKLGGRHKTNFEKEMAGNLDGLAATLKDVKESGEGLEGIGSKIEGAIGIDAPKTVKDIQAIDQALSSLVTSGATEEAARGFDYLSDQAALAGISTAELKTLLPGYTDALTDVDVQQQLTAKSAGDTSAALGTIPGMSQEAAKALQEARDAARKTGEAFFDISNGVDDADVSLDAWISKMADQAKALNDFASNAKRAGKRGLEDGLIQDLQNLGPEGARRMAQLADATDAEIGRANRAWRKGQRAIDNYTDAVGGVEPVPLDAKDKASKKIRGVIELITGLDGDSATVTINTIKNSYNVNKDAPSGGDTLAEQLGIPKKKKKKKAYGGPIYGPGTGTSDDVPIMASNGEHMWTDAEVKAAGGHGAVMQLRRMALAGQTREYAGRAAPQMAMAGAGGPLEVGTASTRAIADAVERAVANGMHGARFQTLPDGSVRLIMKRGR